MTGDLFGFDRVDGPGKGEVALALVFHRASDKAVLLSETGKPADAKWVPLRFAKRGEGPDVDVWTMPKWKADELGWS